MSHALIANRFKLAEHVRSFWHVTPFPEDTPETVLDPKWWVHVSRSLRPGDLVEVLPETGEWHGILIVRDAGIWGARVAYVAGPTTFGEAAPVAAPEEYEVKWSGPHTKWRATRISDNTVLRDGFQTREEGEVWVKSHRKAMAA